MSTFTVSHKSLRDLGWFDLCDILAGLTATTYGKKLCGQISFFIDAENILSRQARIKELQELASEDQLLQLGHLNDLRPTLSLLSKNAILPGEEMLSLAEHLQWALAIKQYFRKHCQIAPLLWQDTSKIDHLPDLLSHIKACFDETGTISDNASFDLAQLRVKMRQLQESIQTKMEKMLKGNQADSLMDNYYTIRNSRYVLPVRTDCKSKIDGIVHDTSQSGQTLFLEPATMVEVGNQLKIAQSRVKEEENSILTGLSKRASQSLIDLLHLLDQIGQVDLLLAQARLATQMDSTLAAINRDGAICLKSMRHPLLVLKKLQPKTFSPDNSSATQATTSPQSQEVVANHIIIPAGKKTVIISGPNTGGKTVSLKGLGLCLLMMQAGMPITTETGSSLPIFNGIFTAFGDDQDLQRGLSSFSGHLLAVQNLLQEANSGSLVLVDELVSDTDPDQGAALARSILEDLCQRNIFTFVSTHYQQLKVLSLQDERYYNLAVGFSLADLSPTFKITPGIPGSSRALAIAGRLGLEDRIIARARNYIHQEGARLEKILVELTDICAQHENQKKKYQKLVAQVERDSNILREKIDRQNAREKAFVAGKQQELLQEIEHERREISTILIDLKQNKRPARKVLIRTEEELSRRGRKIKNKIDRQKPPFKAIEIKGLIPGQSIYLPSLKREGEVLEIDLIREKVTILVGEIKMKVNAQEIAASPRGTNQAVKTGLKTTPVAQISPKSRSEVTIQTSQTSLDIRGLRLDEAKEAVIDYLDKSLLNGMDMIYIIHGHGSGALKNGIREMLKESRYVESFRAGQREEGGDGVTVVKIK